MSELPDAWKPPATPPATTRRRAIGGTDAAAVLAYYEPTLYDIAKYSTAADVWMRLVHNIEKPKSARMTRGLRVEPTLRAIYERDVGPCGEPPGVLQHADHPWFTCSPDGLTPERVVEFKTCSVWASKGWGDVLTDQMPPSYLMQCLWNCAITDRNEAHLLVAFGTDFKDDTGADDFAFTETRIYVAQRDAELEARMLSACGRFVVEHLETKLPPKCEPKENRRAWKKLLKGEQP